MWDALDNVKPLVKQGGQLYIAIYNELHPLTDRWLSIKRTYNRLPSIARWPFAVAIIAALESRAFIHFARHRTVREYLRLWTHYHSVRGMSKWHDWFDWIGGYPYECATIEELAEYFGKDGFALEWLESRATGTGCNELSFRRVAGVGEWVDNLIAKSSLVVGRFGRRVNGPFHADKEGYVARLPKSLSTRRAGDLVLFHDGELVGSAAPGGQPGTIIVAPPSWPMERVAATKIHVVAGSCRTLEATDVQKSQEHSFRVAVPDLQHVSDDKTPSRDRSPVFVFEDKRQLAMPHALHAEIVAFGQGRFSHWADYILFSTSDNSDPRSNGRSYELVAAELDDD
jgi:hypothetical protein